MRQILDGIRVLDAGTVLAAPGASAMLADFGAEVIKIEHPEHGDPLRGYDPQLDGESLTHKVTNRGKRSITLDLSRPEGRDVFLDLVRVSDVVIMNYRVPTVRKWGLGEEVLREVKEDIVVLHLTGYGMDGPYADRPGFARVAEAFVGLTHTTGYPDRAPVPSGYAIADAMGGVYGAFSVMLALFERERSGTGQLIDLALYELLAKTLDAMYVGCLHGQPVPERTGTTNPTIAPHDIYPMADGVYVSLPVSTQSMFVRLCEIIECPELVDDPRFLTNQLRLRHRGELDDVLRGRFAMIDSADFLDRANRAGVAAAPILDPLRFARDDHVCQRGFFAEVWDEGLGRPITMQSVVPKLSRTPGAIAHAGERLGASTEDVLTDLLGRSPEELERLRRLNVIAEEG